MLSENSRVVIVGSGEVGKNIYRTLRNRFRRMVIVVVDSDEKKTNANIDGTRIGSISDIKTADPDIVVGAFSASAQEYKEWFQFVRQFTSALTLSAVDIFQMYPEVRGWPILESGRASAMSDTFLSIESQLSDNKSKEQYRAYWSWVCGEKGVFPIEGRGEDQYLNELTETRFRDAVFVDGGAYTGDTLGMLLSNQAVSLKKYIGIEPDGENYKKLSEFISGLTPEFQDKCEIYKAALSSVEGEISFSGSGDQMARVDDSSANKIKAVVLPRLGDLANKPTVIKLDLEGSEYKVLTSALQSLKDWRPTLCIAIYHNPEDFFEIPRLLQSSLDNYRFFVRSHNRFGLDFVLYALPS